MATRVAATVLVAAIAALAVGDSNVKLESYANSLCMKLYLDGTLVTLEYSKCDNKVFSAGEMVLRDCDDTSTSYVAYCIDLATNHEVLTKPCEAVTLQDEPGRIAYLVTRWGRRIHDGTAYLPYKLSRPKAALVLQLVIFELEYDGGSASVGGLTDRNSRFYIDGALDQDEQNFAADLFADAHQWHATALIVKRSVTPNGQDVITLGPPITLPPPSVSCSATWCPNPAYVYFNISDDEPKVQRVEIFVDGSGTPVYSRPDVPTGPGASDPIPLPDGYHQAHVVVTDYDGLTATCDTTILVDTTPPIVIVTGPDAPCNKGVVSVTWTAVDATTKVETQQAKIDGVLLCAPPSGSNVCALDTRGLTDGYHTIEIDATDSCGNVGRGYKTILIDNIPPDVSLDKLPCSRNTIQFTWTVDNPPNESPIDHSTVSVDNIVRCTIPGNGPAVCPFDTHTVADGWHTLTVEVVDQCGNSKPVSEPFKVDNTPPTCNIISPKDGATIVGPVYVRFRVADNLPYNLKSWQVLTDGRLRNQKFDVPQGVYVSGPHFLTLGTHKITVVVTDDCDNTSTCEIGVNIEKPSCPGIRLPNLIWDANNPLTDPFDKLLKTVFRPEMLNIDSFTIRDVLLANSVAVGPNTIVQVAKASKITSAMKCTEFGEGPGSDFNTNFSASSAASNADLDKSTLAVALQITSPKPFLGNRDLLFSPPYTTYMLEVIYVLRDPISGRTGIPKNASLCWTVKVPTRDDIRNNVEYFSTVPAGATQKPKITPDTAAQLYAALDVPDDLGALLAIETAVAMAAVDFSVLRDAVDARFMTGYLVDDDEEPIGCLLTEMANFALWH